MPNTPNTSSFYSIFDGLLRTNRFTVNMSKLSSKYTDLVESVEFPSIELATTEFIHNTQPILKIPYAKQPSQTCSITFRIDGKGQLLSGLLSELSKFVPVVGSDYAVAYVSEYWQEINITILDQNTAVKKCVLHRALLTGIDSMQMSYDDRDNYIKQTTTWSFQDMIIQ